MKLNITRPVWVEINLDNLRYNIINLKKILTAKTDIMAVIKADAYGHGALQIIETLIKENINKFAVAVLSEAIEIRKNHCDIQILLLGYIPDINLKELIKLNLTPSIFSLRQAKILNELAKNANKTVSIHINIDTGMHRVGLPVTLETIKAIKQIYSLSNIELEGIYTHFATADELDKTYTMKQVEKFNFIIDELEKINVKIPVKHVSNSAAILDLPNLNYDMVRPGLLLYGLYPSTSCENIINLKQVMSLHSRVYHMRTLKKGESVSYGLTYTAKKKSKIALVPIGYADGYSRNLSNKSRVILKDKNAVANVIGNICMDQMIIDITNIDINGGDEVILLGEDSYHKITTEEIANILGTINYEILCNISDRVPRVYKKNNRIVLIKER